MNRGWHRARLTHPGRDKPRAKGKSSRAERLLGTPHSLRGNALFSYLFIPYLHNKVIRAQTRLTRVSRQRIIQIPAPFHRMAHPITVKTNRGKVLIYYMLPEDRGLSLDKHPQQQKFGSIQLISDTGKSCLPDHISETVDRDWVTRLIGNRQDCRGFPVFQRELGKS